MYLNIITRLTFKISEHTDSTVLLSSPAGMQPVNFRFRCIDETTFLKAFREFSRGFEHYSTQHGFLRALAEVSLDQLRSQEYKVVSYLWQYKLEFISHAKATKKLSTNFIFTSWSSGLFCAIARILYPKAYRRADKLPCSRPPRFLQIC